MASELKPRGPRELRDRLSRFLSDHQTQWMQPLLDDLRGLREGPVELWCLGGLPRDLVAHSRPKRPRDIDLVAGSDDLGPLLDVIQATVRRKTRFGGLQLSVKNWTVDVWPLSQTWAFREGLVSDPSFNALPRTTFFNIEAVAIELGSRGPNGQRRVADAGFFDALATRTIDINFEPNPFPALCVVRALVFASRLQFALAPRLVAYVARKMAEHSIEELLDAQVQHYGQIRINREVLGSWRTVVEHHLASSPLVPLNQGSDQRQLCLWG